MFFVNKSKLSTKPFKNQFFIKMKNLQKKLEKYTIIMYYRINNI